MEAEYEGVRTELTDLEQTLQPSKQSHKGHHLEAGRLIAPPTPEVFLSRSELNLSSVGSRRTANSPHRCFRAEMSIFAQNIDTAASADYTSSYKGFSRANEP